MKIFYLNSSIPDTSVFSKYRVEKNKSMKIRVKVRSIKKIIAKEIYSRAII